MQKKKSASVFFELFKTFFTIGAYTFGGGYAMIPLIHRETVQKHGWISDDDILEIIAIAESTPGPISVNAATFVGYRTAGVLGAASATFGLILPAFLTIYCLAFILREFSQLPAVKYAFFGIRASVLALLVKAVMMMYKKSKKGLIPYIVMVFAFAATALLDLHVLVIVACCAVIGIVTSMTMKKEESK